MYVTWFALLVLGTCIFVIFLGRWRFQSLVRAETNALLSQSKSSVGPNQLRVRRGTLPDPVRRYLRYAITERAPAIRTAHLKHGGGFRRRPGERWFYIEGEQYFATAEPGFVWNATIRPVFYLWIAARDLLLSGRGNMLVKLVSTFTIADASGVEINQGASLRWLAENIWFPYGFVGDHIEWGPIDDHSARATLQHGDMTVSAIFHIDNDGKLVSLRGDRYRDIGGGKAVLTPWTGRCSDYREFNGFRVPSTVEVAWELESGQFSYARFRVTTLEYNVADRS